MRFVDEIQVDATGGWAEGRFFVDPGADYLQDHFPGFPALPGLLMLEVSVRTAAALWAASAYPPRDGAVLERVDNLRVVRRVVPGETLRVRVSREAVGSGLATFTARGAVDAETAVRTRFRMRAATREATR